MSDHPCSARSPVVETSGLQKAFGATVALAGLDIAIARGEVLALMGANGAGKSTLVSILGVSARADAGTVRLEDRPFAPATPAEARRAGIAVVHQATERAGIPGLTVGDALTLGHLADGRSPIFVNFGVKAIVIDHGLPESLKDVAQKALDAGITVVTFDVNLDNPKISQVEQSDHALAQQALDQAVADNGKSFDAGYVYVAGFAPLDRRNEMWTEFKAKNPGVVEKARFGSVSSTTAATTDDQAKAALRANPGISVVFPPYDEFARGVKLAVNELDLAGKVRI